MLENKVLGLTKEKKIGIPFSFRLTWFVDGIPASML